MKNDIQCVFTSVSVYLYVILYYLLSGIYVCSLNEGCSTNDVCLGSTDNNFTLFYFIFLNSQEKQECKFFQSRVGAW